MSASFFQLRSLHKLKSFLSFGDLETVIHAFISTRLDYCNVLYAGVIDKCAKTHLDVVGDFAFSFSKTIQ